MKQNKTTHNRPLFDIGLQHNHRQSTITTHPLEKHPETTILSNTSPRGSQMDTFDMSDLAIASQQPMLFSNYQQQPPTIKRQQVSVSLFPNVFNPTPVPRTVPLCCLYDSVLYLEHCGLLFPLPYHLPYATLLGPMGPPGSSVVSLHIVVLHVYIPPSLVPTSCHSRINYCKIKL